MEARSGDRHTFAARPLSRRPGFLFRADSDPASRSPSLLSRSCHCPCCRRAGLGILRRSLHSRSITLTPRSYGSLHEHQVMGWDGGCPKSGAECVCLPLVMIGPCRGARFPSSAPSFPSRHVCRLGRFPQWRVTHALVVLPPCTLTMYAFAPRGANVPVRKRPDMYMHAFLVPIASAAALSTLCRLFATTRRPESRHLTSVAPPPRRRATSA